MNNKSKKYRRRPNSNDEDSNNEDYVREHTKLNVNNKSKENRRRPNPVTVKTPEKNHFTNNNKKKNKKPLIALIGDSTLKNLSGYQLGKNCKGTTIMVRSQRGGKVKNIKNLMIDLLEDTMEVVGKYPEAICFHVGTNDISSGKSTNDIKKELSYLLRLTQRQGIVPVMSLLTRRTDKCSDKVYHLNQVIVDLCNELGVGYIEHQNINENHLNEGGLHIASECTHIFSNNFVNYFDSLVRNEFILL